MSKLMELSAAVALVQDGDLLGIGGNALNRVPAALCCEIARQQKRALRLLTTAGSLDVDMLCLAGCVKSVDAAFISYETEFGTANHYRKAVQSGQVKANEHSCYTLISGLRAAAAGLPFMPVFGLKEGQLLEACDYFKRIPDPFSGEMISVVRAYRPDVSILHVDEADETGNARIEGVLYDDILLSRASKKLIVSAERIVPSSKFRFSQQKAQIPGFMVSAVVHAPKGAAPGAFLPAYDIDKKKLQAFLAIPDKNSLMEWLEKGCVSSFIPGRWQK